MIWQNVLVCHSVLLIGPCIKVRKLFGSVIFKMVFFTEDIFILAASFNSVQNIIIRSAVPYGVTKPQLVNIPQAIEAYLLVLGEGLIDRRSTLLEVMAWHCKTTSLKKTYGALWHHWDPMCCSLVMKVKTNSKQNVAFKMVFLIICI